MTCWPNQPCPDCMHRNKCKASKCLHPDDCRCVVLCAACEKRIAEVVAYRVPVGQNMEMAL